MAEERPEIDDLVGLFEAYLEDALEQPDGRLNTDRLDDLLWQIGDEAFTASHVRRLLPKLIQLLFVSKNDPTYIADLATSFLGRLNFTEALEIATDEHLILALQSQSPSIQLLSMTVIEKAASSVSNTAIISNKHALIEEFIHVWLTSPSTAVGEKGTATLGKLLAVECGDENSPTHGNGGASTTITNDLSHQLSQQRLFWRRIFSDQNIYRSILAHCSNKTIQNEPNGVRNEILSPEQLKSLAQHRLMNALVVIASLDFSALTRSDFPDIDKEFGLANDEHGLLYFASLYMIDHSDILLEKTYEAFFQDLIIQLSTVSITAEQVEFLKILLGKVINKDANMKDALKLVIITEETEEIRAFLRTLGLLQ